MCIDWVFALMITPLFVIIYLYGAEIKSGNAGIDKIIDKSKIDKINKD